MTDGVGNYGNNENCRVRALQPLMVNFVEYGIESCCDSLTVMMGSGFRNVYSFRPAGSVSVPQNGVVIWSTDDSTTSYGFKICALEPTPFAPNKIRRDPRVSETLHRGHEAETNGGNQIPYVIVHMLSMFTYGLLLH